MTKKVCGWCGGANTTTGKFCGADCRIESNKKRRQKGPKKCEWCGHWFRPDTENKRGASKTCCDECGEAYRAYKKVHRYDKPINDSNISTSTKPVNREKCGDCDHWLNIPGPYVTDTCLNIVAERNLKRPYCYAKNDFSAFSPIPEESPGKSNHSGIDTTAIVQRSGHSGAAGQSICFGG